MKDQRALVAGGGIGGLTAAICLARIGCRVKVFEQAPAFEEVGAGIQLSPNCTRVLHDLGLDVPLKEWAFLPQAAQFRQWRTGKLIAESALGRESLSRYGYPYYHIHRGDLIRILVEAAEASPNIELELSARVDETSQNDSGAHLHFGEQRQEGDLIVGADGVHSKVRTALWGEEQPRFTGTVAWRALVKTSDLPTDLIKPVSTVWWGPGKHFVHYYVKGGEFVNIVCVVEKAGWEVESWTERGRVDELKADFSGWHPDLHQLIDHVDEDSLFKWALLDRRPMATWGQGRITLLGDACHPTLPFMAQGAAMAIEDAAVLTACLDRVQKIPEALQQYEGLRRRRTAQVQRQSRRNAVVFHLSGVRALLRDQFAQVAGDRTMRRLYAYDALKVGA